MKRFPARHATIAAARRLAAAASPQGAARVWASALAASPSVTFACALLHSRASYTGEASNAYAQSKRRTRAAAASLLAAKAPIAATATAAPTRPARSRNSCGRGAALKGSASLAAEPPAQLQTPPSPSRRSRRTAAARALAISGEGHVKPMRGRRRTESPRQRRTPRQKAVRLLTAHEDREAAEAAAVLQTAGGAWADSTMEKAGESVKGEGELRSEAGEDSTEIGQEEMSVKGKATGSAAPASQGTQEAASLTTAQLLARLEVTSFVEKVVAQVRDWAAAMREWTQPTTDPTLREWERQLLLSLRKDSFTDCSVIQQAMQQRYEDNFGRSSHDVAFLTLYARVLTNNAVFCLFNFMTYRATALLTEAIAVAEAAYALKQQQEADGATNGSGTPAGNTQRSHLAKGKKNSTGRGSAAPAGKKSKEPRTTSKAAPHVLMSDPENYLVFLRVLLANAYASDQQFWKAAEQYQLVLCTLERSPLWTPDQLTPGASSPLPLNHTFVEEDARLFHSNPSRVDHAVSQGTAQLLLLQSQGVGSAAVPLLHAQLAMARLHRHAGRYAESQLYYEKYLDAAAEQLEGEDVGAVMLELGRLLLYKVQSEEAALVYLEAASTILLEDAQDLLEAAEAATGAQEKVAARVAAGNVAQRAAGAIYDTAMAFHAQDKSGKAIGLLEGCLQLLDAAGLGRISVRVRQQYANMLATISLVDRALEEYTRALEVLQGDGGEAVEQLGSGGRLAPLTAAEVEGHLAFCLQTYVGDHKRAMAHYRNVMQGTFRANPAVQSAKAQLSKRARRQRAAWATVALSSSQPPDAQSGGRHGGARMRVGTGGAAAAASALPSIDLSLQPDLLHWVLSNYVACCERVGAYEEAVAVQNRVIEIEGALGGNVVDSYVKLIFLHQEAGEAGKALALCFYIFCLPDTMMPPQTRLEVANAFATSCHQLGNSHMGAVLLQAVQQVRGDHSAVALVNYATCLKMLEPGDRLQLDGMMDIEASMRAIGSVFRRAASIVVADTALDTIEAAEEKSSGKGHEAAAAAVAERTGTGSTATPGLTEWSHDKVARAMNSLIVLSRGAFFFQLNRFTSDAADLYAHALAQMNQMEASMPTLTDALQREMGILLVNYATLLAAEDPKLAASLYERAAAVCPSYADVAEVVADFFVQSGDYEKGSGYMKRFLSVNPAAGGEMHLRLARLGTGPAWETMANEQRVEVMEHLLRGLGISSERAEGACAAMAQRHLNTGDGSASSTSSGSAGVMSLVDVAPLLMDGVASTMSEEAVSLATYVVQTRFQEPQLLNRMYRRALLRFPQHATMLVNYATLCMFSGYYVLARKYIAKAFAASSGDLNCTMCYAHYLCRLYDGQQVGSGEALYNGFLERNPTSARAHAAFANFMAGVMPTPFKTEEHFRRALELAPRSEEVVLQYGQFMWACTDSKNVYANEEVRRRIFDRTEQLFKEAVELSPNSFTACHQLGTFYANRHNRFEEAMTMLSRAHKLQPGNVEVLRHILSAMHEECLRVQREEERQSGAVSGQGGRLASSHSSRLASLISGTRDMCETVLRKDPKDRATLERYARFAVETLKDPSLAASLYKRIQELNRE